MGRAVVRPEPRLARWTWWSGARVNRSAVERRAATLSYPAHGEEGVAGRLADPCHRSGMDLTTLAGDDTPGNVQRLCAKARQPVRQDMLAALGLGELHVAAVCVYHNLVAPAVAALAGSGIPVAAVSTAFLPAQNPLPQKIAEIEASVAAGAQGD